MSLFGICKNDVLLYGDYAVEVLKLIHDETTWSSNEGDDKLLNSDVVARDINTSY